MEIYFIRHGETDWNKQGFIQGRTNNNLNKKGEEQAEKIASKLENVNPDYLMSSPLKRAFQTMEILREKNSWDKEIIENEDFIERNFGEYEGVHFEKYKEEKNLNKLKLYEKDEELERRVEKGINKIVKEKNSEDVIIITAHSHTLKSILVNYFSKDYDYEYHLNNCAIVHIKIKDGGIKLISID